MSEPHPRQQKGPYLQRNWKIGIQAAALPTSASRHRLSNGDSNDQDVRPSKRRRFEGAADSRVADGFLLHEDPVYIQPAMHVDVVRIFHKDISRAQQNAVPNGALHAATKDVETQARCKITITTPGRTPNDANQVLYCDSQMCKIRSTLDAAGACRTARVLLQPFQIPEEKIYVERRDDVVFYLADTYSIKVELESAGSGNWPPLNLAHTTVDDLKAFRHWTLSAEVSNLLERTRRFGVLKLFEDTDLGTKTEFLVDIDVRWATLLPPKQEEQGKENTSFTSAANCHGKQDFSLSNGPVSIGHATSNGYSNSDEARRAYSLEDDMDEDAEGELTPSRSLRARGSTNYNLKDLSAKAQGRQPRRRLKNVEDKKLDPGARVLYRLPTEMLPLREVVVDDFSCCVCQATNQSFAQLRAHLFSHSQYEFEAGANPGRIGHQLDMSIVTESVILSRRPMVYQLGKATAPFDLDKYIEGDDSWATSRLGPHNEDRTIPLAGSRRIPQSRPSVPKPAQVQTLADGFRVEGLANNLYRELGFAAKRRRFTCHAQSSLCSIL